MLFTLRISLLDRPGMLALVAGGLGQIGADIVTLDVVDRGDGRATDVFCVQAREGLAEAIRRSVEGVPGAVVEAIRPVSAPPDPSSPLHLAAEMTSGDEDVLPFLVRRLPVVLWASWSMAVRVGDDEPVLLARGPGAPTGMAFDTPWLPLYEACRLPAAQWMPSPWRISASTGTLEMAAAPLGDDGTSAVLIARKWGARFLPVEVRQLGILATIAGRRLPIAV